MPHPPPRLHFFLRLRSLCLILLLTLLMFIISPPCCSVSVFVCMYVCLSVSSFFSSPQYLSIVPGNVIIALTDSLYQTLSSLGVTLPHSVCLRPSVSVFASIPFIFVAMFSIAETFCLFVCLPVFLLTEWLFFLLLLLRRLN